MCEALKELFAEELKEADKKGMERAKRIFQLSAKGVSEEKIAEECGVPVEQVHELLR